MWAGNTTGLAGAALRKLYIYSFSLDNPLGYSKPELTTEKVDGDIGGTLDCVSLINARKREAPCLNR